MKLTAQEIKVLTSLSHQQQKEIDHHQTIIDDLLKSDVTDPAWQFREKIARHQNKIDDHTEKRDVLHTIVNRV